MPALLLIMDGLGDLPSQKLGTPLEEAKTPFMDKLAREGTTGFHTTIGRGKIVGSDIGHLLLFGYGVEHYPGRGPLEALGAGINIKEKDIAFRTNMAKVENDIITDRRAGRIETKEAKKAEKELNVKIDSFTFIYKHTVEHRGVLVIKNAPHKVEGNDPHKENTPYTFPTSTNKKLEKAIKKYLKYASKIIEKKTKGKANALLLRGWGKLKKIEPIEEKHNLKAIAIAGGALYKGVAKYVGMDVANVKGATGDKHTNLNAKVKRAIEEAHNYDLVFLHIKATDSFGHDGDFQGKKSFIEKVDKALSQLKKENPFSTIVITGDHSTPCIMKAHSCHPVPLLIWGKFVRKDKTKAFSEKEAEEGGLGFLKATDVIEIIKCLEKKQPKTGS